jgi:glycosyltransferase involved in cell wall biosynthesis
MRVALLSYSAQAGDAIGNNVAEKVAFFRERAAEVRVFVETGRRLHPAVAPCCTVLDSTEPTGPWWRYLRSADIVSVEFGQHYSLLALLPLLAGGKPRVLLDYHGITPPELWGSHNREALVQGLQQRGLAWCADATIAHSSFTQEELNQRTGLPLQRLPRLGYVVDAELFSPGSKSPHAEREHYTWRSLGLDEARVLLFVGRFAPNKRPSLVVEALHHLADLAPPVHAVLVGDQSDLYQAEAQGCQTRARELGVADRLHLVGPRLGSQLRDLYRGADVLILPSLWESFCIPVVEAMASGLPVIAARTTALPETVASAGLTFMPDDAADLARQVRRVLTEPAKRLPARPRIAVIACRWGRDIASGAESSLRRMALALASGQCQVGVFTTGTSCEAGTINDLPAGAAIDDGLAVHRFAVDSCPPNGEARENPAHPIRSAALIEHLASRLDDFDLLITGPYLAALTVDVARRWPDKTVVVPCFHDEAMARHPLWQELYSRVAGLLYHSPEEQSLAERVLGVNHPGSAVVGTWIDTLTPGDAVRGQASAGGPYLLYCGRYVSEKNLPLLLEYASRFAAALPGQVRFVFTGKGEVAIPREAWAVDLGLVPDDVRRDLLAGAVALVQLSSNESLSLAALEAWAQATPVLAQQRCSVLAGHIERSGGGLAIDSYEQFAAAVHRLLERPDERERLGRSGRQYVQQQFGAADAFRDRLLETLEHLGRPLAEQMRQRGLERAAVFDRATWRRTFGRLVEHVLHSGPPEVREDLQIKPRAARCEASTGAGSILVGVRVVNRGTQAALAQGPAQTLLTARVLDAAGRAVALALGQQTATTPLPALLMPGRALSASVLVPVPAGAGAYEVHLAARRADRLDEACGATTQVPLIVGGAPGLFPRDGCLGILDEAQAALAQAQRLQRLPDDYADVTQGALAGVKLRIKRKLLGNFKKAYVDVLSRQQSACNQQLLQAVQTLTECCQTLDHAVRQLQARVAELEAGRQPRYARSVASQLAERTPEPDLAKEGDA